MLPKISVHQHPLSPPFLGHQWMPHGIHFRKKAIEKVVWALESRKIWVECFVASDMLLTLSEPEIPTP